MTRITLAVFFVSLVFFHAKGNFVKDVFAKFVQYKNEHPETLEQQLASIISFEIPSEKSHEEKGDQEVKVQSKPKFCNDLDCPKFREVADKTDYEVRDYVQTNWVSTSMQGADYKDASNKMFFKLFDYIQGNNEAEQTIDMTAPVITSIIPGQGPTCASNFTMSFFMSPSIGQPPAPKDKSVFLSSLPKQRVYVKAFGGFAKESDWLDNARMLGEALKKDNLKFDDSFFYSAGYNSPYQVFARHNEVWYIAK